MEWLQIGVLSVMVGCVVAGLVWFGMGIVENVRARSALPQMPAGTETEAESGAAAKQPPSDSGRPAASAQKPPSTRGK